MMKMLYNKPEYTAATRLLACANVPSGASDCFASAGNKRKNHQIKEESTDSGCESAAGGDRKDRVFIAPVACPAITVKKEVPISAVNSHSEAKMFTSAARTAADAAAATFHGNEAEYHAICKYDHKKKKDDAELNVLASNMKMSTASTKLNSIPNAGKSTAAGYDAGPEPHAAGSAPFPPAHK
jgi:hypothetical protein